MFYNGLYVIEAGDAFVKFRCYGSTTGGASVTSEALDINSPVYDLIETKRVANVGDRIWDYAYTSLDDYWFHKVFGQFGANPNKVPWRPAVFFTSVDRPYKMDPNSNAAIQNAMFPSWYIFGMTCEWLTEKIQAF